MFQRNPIARSFLTGANHPQVVPGNRPRIRKVKHREREMERDFE